MIAKVVAKRQEKKNEKEEDKTEKVDMATHQSIASFCSCYYSFNRVPLPPWHLNGKWNAEYFQ